MPFKDGIYVDDENEEVIETPFVPATPLEPAIQKPITKSILLTVKKMLGIAEEYHAFDLDIIININSVFLSLNQLGIGSATPFQINDAEPVWSDFLGDQEEFLAGVQTYVYLKTRLLFDPPTSSFHIDAIKKQCEELEWRFIAQPKNQEAVEAVDTFNIGIVTDPLKKEEAGDHDSDQNGSTEQPPVEEPKDEETEEETEMIETASFMSVRPLRAQANKKNKPINLLDIFS